MAADEVGALASETRGAEAGVIDTVAGLGPNHLDHGADDVALGVELPGVARGVGGVGGDALQEVLVDFG